VIDEDQGKSAAGSAASQGRDGFAQLVSAVGLGEVGIVLALEVSRLARNSAEWYRLLELAALAGTLIADDATVYEPRLFNDRLLLGLRGTISEVELHCIQERLQGARSSKARRGELPLRLPAGCVAGRDGAVELDPDHSIPIRRCKGRAARSSRSSSGSAPPRRCCTPSMTTGSGSHGGAGGAGTPRPACRSSGCGRATRRSTPC
jgi:DNA invertase Pin-like site-specific DNA recombinase